LGEERLEERMNSLSDTCGAISNVERQEERVNPSWNTHRGLSSEEG